MAVVVLGLGMACGSLGGPEFTGNRGDDGVGPYRDQGKLLLCQGERRLVGPAASPSRGPGGSQEPIAAGDRVGFCRPGARPAAACQDDGECRSRERCVCGTCTVLLCAGDADCGDGARCNLESGGCERTCDGATPCAAGESCLGGRCVTPCQADSSGGGGDGDEVCQTGEVCSRVFSRCIVVRCSADDDPACAKGEQCAYQVEAREMREPFVLAGRDGEPAFRLWLEMDGSTDRAGRPVTAIWHAESPDGVRYRVTPEEPVLAPAGMWEGRRVGAPALLRQDDGQYLLVYAGGVGKGLGRARSADGLAFEREDGPLLVPEAEWEDGRLDSPAVAPGGEGEILVLYEAAGGIGLASGAADGPLERRPGPLLAPEQVTDPVLWRAVDQVGGPVLLHLPEALTGPRYRLFFHARGLETSAFQSGDGPLQEVPANYSIGMAAGALVDGEGGPTLELDVLPFNPVLDRAIDFVRHLSERQPAIVASPGEAGGGLEGAEGSTVYRLLYAGAEADLSGDTGLGVAVSPAPDLPFPE